MVRNKSHWCPLYSWSHRHSFVDAVQYLCVQRDASKLTELMLLGRFKRTQFSLLRKHFFTKCITRHLKCDCHLLFKKFSLANIRLVKARSGNAFTVIKSASPHIAFLRAHLGFTADTGHAEKRGHFRHTNKNGHLLGYSTRTAVQCTPYTLLTQRPSVPYPTHNQKIKKSMSPKNAKQQSRRLKE